MNIESSPCSRGFTLVEVLVALVVFSMVLSLILFGFEQGRMSWIRGQQNVIALSDLSHRQFWLERMFLQANAATFSVDYGTESSYLLGTEGELMFLTDAPVISGPGTYALVKLLIQNENNTDTQSLVLYEWENRDPYYGIPDGESEAKKIVLLKGIKKARLEYFLDARTTPSPLETIYNNFVPRYNDKWAQEYDTRFEVQLPRKIRFDFEIKNQLYTWTFVVNRHSYVAGQNEPLVFQ